MENGDPFQLKRFEDAQEPVYELALSELRAGEKKSHWIWFIFPQLAGLGTSAMSWMYAIRSVAEAEAYLRHPVLGPRLAECCEAMLGVEGKNAREILGSPDDMKLRSCATLFAAVSGAGSVFERLLEKYYNGESDEKTLAFVRADRQGNTD
jgi:uncharacterized protein (DUF1810 family)